MPTIEDADRTADELEALLQRRGIEIGSGSRLEEALLFTRKVLDVRRGEELPNEQDDRTNWRELSGINDLGRRVVSAEKAMPAKFESLLPLLKLFGSQNGQLAQMTPSRRTVGGELGAEHSDKMFELLVALCLLPAIEDLELDRGEGENPDLLFRLSGSPVKWGIACKRMYSREPARFRDTVIKAIDQIERSVAERGMVFVSVVNLIDHDAFYPMDNDCYHGFSRERLLEMIEAEQTRLTSETVGRSDQELATAFLRKKALPGIIHYFGTMYLTGSEDAPVDKVVQQAWARGLVNDQLLQAFQSGLNSTVVREP